MMLCKPLWKVKYMDKLLYSRESLLQVKITIQQRARQKNKWQKKKGGALPHKTVQVTNSACSVANELWDTALNKAKTTLHIRFVYPVSPAHPSQVSKWWHGGHEGMWKHTNFALRHTKSKSKELLCDFSVVRVNTLAYWLRTSGQNM